VEYRQLRTYAGRGTNEGRFAKSLRGLAIDGSGRILCAGDSKVVVFDGEGAVVRSWATHASPWSVAVGGDGSVWVGEAGRVEVFSPEGKLLRFWKSPQRFGRVTALGTVGEEFVVADAADRCLRRFAADGTFLNDIGKDTRMKGFLIPNGTLDFSVDGEGILHITNPGKHRVERYTLDDRLLGHIGRFSGPDPSGFSGCCNPTNVTVVGDRIYVTEKAEPRAKVYDLEGKMLAIISDDAFEPGCKNMDLVVDSAGRVHVADTVRLEVLVFARDESDNE